MLVPFVIFPEIIIFDNGDLKSLRITPLKGRAPYLGVNPFLASKEIALSVQRLVKIFKLYFKYFANILFGNGREGDYFRKST